MPNTFENNRKVKILRLVDCEITMIYETLFVSMPQLEVLDLSKNDLKSFDMKTVKGNPNLQTLKLQNCALTEITNIELIQNHFPKLSEIYLDGNAFTCQYLKQLVDFLKKRGIKVIGSSANGPASSYNGIACNGDYTNDVEIMQPGGGAGVIEKQLDENQKLPPTGGDIPPPDNLYAGDATGPVCCVEIVELKAKVKKLEEEILACKQKTLDYVNEAMAAKKQEIEVQVRALVKQMLEEKTQKAVGGTYMHSRFQNEEFTQG